jgi:ferrochelatase
LTDLVAIPIPSHEFCYRHQCYETTKQVVKLGIPEGKYSQTFQSRLAGDKWLTPYTDVEVNKMPGIKKLAVVTLLLSLIVETLEEIAWKPITSSKSMWRRNFPCLNDSDEWCQTVGNWINEWATVEKQQLKWLFLRKN